MRTHDHEFDDISLRPRSSRLDGSSRSPQLQAAAAGRTDVLDPAGVLGLQRAVGNSGVSAMLEEERSPVHDVVNSGGGSPLAPDLQDEMQARLGHDFSDVRVHTDSAAHESAQAVNAHAYTVGSNVVFQRNMFDPSSAESKKMLAHELTHVVQQRSGPVDGSDAGGGIKVSDPSDRFEREASANAESAMSKTPAMPSGPAGAAVQRQANHSEDEAVQRQADHSEDEAVQRQADHADAGSSAESVQREAPGEEELEDVQTFVQREGESDEEEESIA